MKRVQLTLAVLFLTSLAFAQQLRFQQASKNLVDPTIVYDRNGDLVIAMTSEDDPSCGSSCTSTDLSNIVVTKRTTGGTLVWSKSFNFSDVDRAVHITNEGDNVVVLGNVHKSISSPMRSYEYNPVVFVLDQNGALVKGKSIYVPYFQGNDPVDFTASHITTDGTGGYIVTGAITDQNDQCFNSSNVIRIATVIRLDASLNVTWAKHMFYPSAPAYHPYVSANHALMDPGGGLVYVTGQDRVVDGVGGTQSRPVAFVTAMDLATGSTVWHKSYTMAYNEHSYYGVKLLFDNSGNLAWLLRPAVVKGIGQDGFFGIAEVDPSSGAVSNYNVHSFEEGVVSDMEFIEDNVLGVNSLTAMDNQILVGVSWPANNSIFSSLYSGQDPDLNSSLCNAPYFELNTSITLFYPKNMTIGSEGAIHTVTAGFAVAGKETVQLSNFNSLGQMGTHSPNCGLSTCNTCGFRYNTYPMTKEDEEDGEAVGSYPFETDNVPGADITVITRDVCNSGVFADVLLAVDETGVTTTKLFPNPVKEGAALYLSTSSAQGNVAYSVYSMDGKNVLNGSLNAEGKHSISTKGLFPGAYILRWSDEIGGSDVQEFVIE